MKGQSAGDDLTALGGSLTEEALLLRLPSVMACALGMALSLPNRPGPSFSSTSAVLELLLPICASVLQESATSSAIDENTPCQHSIVLPFASRC
jgi:hypothetical protein